MGKRRWGQLRSDQEEGAPGPEEKELIRGDRALQARTAIQQPCAQLRNLFQPQFPPLQHGGRSRTLLLRWVFIVHGMRHVEPLALCLTCGKCPEKGNATPGLLSLISCSEKALRRGGFHPSFY